MGEDPRVWSRKGEGIGYHFRRRRIQAHGRCMKVVFDSNIYVSNLHFGGAISKMFDAIKERKITVDVGVKNYLHASPMSLYTSSSEVIPNSFAFSRPYSRIFSHLCIQTYLFISSARVALRVWPASLITSSNEERSWESNENETTAVFLVIWGMVLLLHCNTGVSNRLIFVFSILFCNPEVVYRKYPLENSG